jgi:exosortase E/protease (VPEID-CTERM system)
VNSSADAGWAVSQPSSNAYRLIPWIGLITLFVAELLVLTLPFDPTGNLAEQGFWAGALYSAQRGIRPIFITAFAAMITFSWPVLQQEYLRVLDESPESITSARWFAAHLVFLSLLILGTRAQATRLSSIAAWEGWLLVWIVVSFAALATWLFSALPPRFWVRWIARSRSALLGAGIAALTAYALGNWTQVLWLPLQRASFHMVATILQLFGQEVVNRPDLMVVGTSRFAVTITSHCSGLEGIGLICAFTGIYLWTCRSELSFPQALLLLPIGAIFIWFLNSVRIAALIFIGGWNERVALKGFHSAAGWIFFNLVAVGLVWTSSQSRLFVTTHESRKATNPALGYLLPSIVFCATALTLRMFAPELFLPAIAVPMLATIWYCRSTLLSLQWKLSWLSVLAGGVAFAMTSLASPGSSAHAAIAPTLEHLSMPATAVLLLLGLTGSAIAIPIAQELAFRGYLARKLVASDFEDVPFDRFTWLSFLGSSIAFGIMEPNWVLGILSGMIFAAAMYRRGLLSDAIAAHICSGCMLFALAAATGKWALLGRL